MREFESVPAPVFAPQLCVGCGGSTGPLVDMQRELKGWGHLYACAQCVERQARALGLTKGKPRTDMLAQVRELKERDIELDRLRERLAVTDADRREFEQKWLEIADRYSVATGRIQQLEERVKQDALQALELVGVGVSVT